MPLVIKRTGFDEFLDPTGGAFIKALIMGQHGSGKTPSAAQWPRPIIADCERGLMSVASLSVPYVSIKRAADMDALLEHLRQECLKPAAKRAYQTLVIDTIDSYQRVLIQERLRTERKESLSGWADWGYLDAKMTQLIERMLNLPMNIVVNMHVKDEREDEGDNSILVKKSRLKGDIKDSIFQDFDLIGQMESSYVSEDGERVLKRQIRWHSEPKYPALRDRSGKLPRFTDVDFTEGDYQRIFDAITAGVDDLPESEDVETLDVEGDGTEAPGPDDKGGPVDKPSLPKKAPAKKAAAKKAPAKKAAAKPEPEPDVAAEDEATKAEIENNAAEDPWKPEELAEPVRHEDEKPVAEGGETPQPKEEKPEEKKPEPAKKAAEKPAAKGAKKCGEQPASMAGRFDAFPGCGKELNAENAVKHQINMLKLKTYVCDACAAAKTPTPA